MGGGTGGNNGIATIPAGSRKVVQSLREIVDCPEQEIYAALRDCNMDPNEAVNRLLSQDPFHEVKSKREKKKENKDTTDSRARSNTSNRGGRTGIDRYPGRSRASASTTTESTGFHGKPAYKDIDSHAYGGSSSVASGNSGNRQSLPVSDPVIVESKVLTVGETDAFPGSSSQPSSGFQPAWFGMPGQVSMADIVKKGRPQSNVSGLLNPINCSNQQRVAPSVSTTHSDFHPLPVHQSSSSRNAHANDDFPLHEQQNPANDEWPQFEHSQGPVSSVLEPRDIPLNGGGQYLDEKHQFSDERPLETNTTHNVGSSVSSKNVQDGESEAFVQHHLHVYEQNEDEGIAANMQQQLSLEKEEEEEDVSTEDDGPAVVIPDHLQVHVTDCQHLSFGSFGSIAATFGGLTSSRHFQDDPTEAPTTSDNASISQVDISDQEQYGEENRRPASSDVDNVHGTGTSITNYETAPVPETEVFQKDGPKSGPGNQYAFASSGPGYDYDSRQALGAAFSHTQTSSQMQNLASYSNVLPTAYSSSLPSALLQTSDHTGRETDLTYLPFNVTQSMPTKFSNPASSISSASVETFRETDISIPQQQQFQNLPPASLATGPALSQHLAMHPYSQPTLPLGHFANMVSYPFLPQNYSYMPSAFQQAFAGNSTYHQSLAAAAVLPQYKNSLSVSSLPQSGAAVPAGYGFGSSNNIPGTNFPLNQSVAPVGTNIGYDDALNSHYKEAAQLLSIQQNENSAMWMHGLGSRTMQPNNYYNYNQGQSQQQTGGFRQVQTPSQHYGGLGYPNFYQSSGMSLEQQQHQMVRGDVSLNGPQVQQPKQSPQLWQNNY